MNDDQEVKLKLSDGSGNIEAELSDSTISFPVVSGKDIDDGTDDELPEFEEMFEYRCYRCGEPIEDGQETQEKKIDQGEWAEVHETCPGDKDSQSSGDEESCMNYRGVEYECKACGHTETMADDDAPHPRKVFADCPACDEESVIFVNTDCRRFEWGVNF